MNRLKISSIAFAITISVSCSHKAPTPDVLESSPRAEHDKKSDDSLILESQKNQISETKTSDFLKLNHGFLKIIYDKKFKIARTVKYELTAENLRERYIKRDTDPFAIDPILAKSYSGLAVKPSIYEKSGYDKGHLAPAEDLSWNEEAFFQSFYMSNMAPQAAKLNQQVWRQLEDKVRDFACGEEKVTILTGALFTNNSSILSNIIVVPEEFYKIVVDETPPRKAIAFLYHQNDQDKNQLEKHIVSISDIEKRAGFSIKEDIDLNGIDSHSRPTSIASWKIAACPQKKNQVSAKKMKKKRKQKNN